ncbi:MAG: hypothetical protein H7A44_03195 [Opitutaceae bacterium]|nr:hypothetical protein [Opitutaceae bacterium]
MPLKPNLASGAPRRSPTFADPTLRFYPLWSINAPLHRDRLLAQVRQFKADGMHGIVLHPRFYPGVPPFCSDAWMAEVSACILEAKRIGLAFWIYDENGWPSGKGDDQVVAKYPDSHSERLELTRARAANSLGSFWTDAQNRIVPAGTAGAQEWWMTPLKNRGVNPLEPEVMGHFLELILERYRTGLDPEAWDHVEAFFFDEPESGMVKGPWPEVAGVSWSRSFPALLTERHGEDYLTKLPLLFARGEGYREVRVQFWEFVCDRFIDAYLKPYHAWCQQHGKWFVGHIKGEETPLFQVPTIGSNHRILRHATMPGIDALERYPLNNFFTRQVGSVSRQFGPGGPSMVEAFGGAGWGASPEDLERYILWLARAGLTEFVFHVCHYRLDSNGISDWPPSFPRHMSWSAAFPAVLDKVRRELTARPNPRSDTLVVIPARGLMAEFEPWELLQTNIHNASTFPDTPASRINTAFLDRLADLDAAGVAYDLTDERTLEEEGVREDGSIRLGHARYDRLLVDPGAVLRDDWVQVGVDWPKVQASSAASAEPVSAAQKLEWTLAATPRNAWLLDTVTSEDLLTHTAQFTTALGNGAPELSLWFADHAVEATLDGRPLVLTRQDEGSSAPVTDLADGKHELVFRLKRPLRANGRGRFRAYVWLEGDFILHSGSPYVAGPQNTVRTDGPLVAKPGVLAPTGELVAGGYAFGSAPVVATAQVELAAPTHSLALAGVAGDAIRVSVDDRDLGWTWGPDWRIDLDTPLAAGAHRLRVELVPSTFNRYGPHHYFNGDWHISSPAVAIGFRSFADAPGAPERTHVPAWHFKPLRLPAAIRCR